MNARATPTEQRRRRRPALACERCRQRKIKCDRNSPCTQCIRTRVEPCIYLPNSRPARDRRSEADHSQAGTTTSGPSTSAIAADAAPPTASTTTVNETHANGFFDVWHSTRYTAGDSTAVIEGPCSTSSTDSSPSPVVQSSPSSVQVLKNRVQELERRLLTPNRPSAEPLAGSLCNDAPALPVKGTYVKTRFFGQGHWRSSVQEVRPFP